MKRASDRVRGLLPSREEARGISVSAFSYCDRTQVKRQGNENGFKHPCARKGFAATPKAGNGGYPFKERENGTESGESTGEEYRPYGRQGACAATVGAVSRTCRTIPRSSGNGVRAQPCRILQSGRAALRASLFLGICARMHQRDAVFSPNLGKSALRAREHGQTTS